MVEYHPNSAKDLSRLHQFGPKISPDVFLGYALHAGKIWKGDILVADIEELEEMDASELHARRLNAKEVLTPMKGDSFMFSVADGTVKISGDDEDLRTSTLIRDRPDRGEEQDNLRGESEGSSSTSRQDSSWYDGEAKGEFLVYLRRFHLQSSRGTLSQTVRAERRVIPYSIEIDRRDHSYRHDVRCDVGEIH